MNDDEMIRKLNSVGKTIFVNEFDLFRDYASGKVTKADAIESLVSNVISNDAGAAIRCSNAILIFKTAREFDALKLITESRVKATIKEKAQAIIATPQKASE